MRDVFYVVTNPRRETYLKTGEGKTYSFTREFDGNVKVFETEEDAWNFATAIWGFDYATRELCVISIHHTLLINWSSET